MTRAVRDCSRDVAMRWMITSVSEVDWKMETGRLQVLPELVGVDQVAVVGHGDGPVGVFDHERLGVLDVGLPAGGIAVVADGRGAVPGS